MYIYMHAYTYIYIHARTHTYTQIYTEREILWPLPCPSPPENFRSRRFCTIYHKIFKRMPGKDDSIVISGFWSHEIFIIKLSAALNPAQSSRIFQFKSVNFDTFTEYFYANFKINLFNLQLYYFISSFGQLFFFSFEICLFRNPFSEFIFILK